MSADMPSGIKIVLPIKPIRLNLSLFNRVPLCAQKAILIDMTPFLPRAKENKIRFMHFQGNFQSFQ